MISLTHLIEPLLRVGTYPLVIALLSSTFCGIGLSLLAAKSERVTVGRRERTSKPEISNIARRHQEKLIYSSIVGCSVTIFVLAWTKSIPITTPFTIFSILISWVYLRNRSRRADAEMLKVWPEVIDHLISAIHSGLSLSEALAGLSTRGPEIIRPHFQEFRNDLVNSGDFVQAIVNLKKRLNTHGSDQILEAILLAKSLGGSELLQIFRTLGDFLRQDLVLRKEIEIKHGWIKNSAHLSAFAPWLLLLLLSSQPGTAEAFAEPGGVFILGLGLLLTGLAYAWMAKLGRLPTQPRVFR
ncbi:MAG TPA: type II secretion system protein F [Candidatus Paceibacterota bacterium]|nr:type II secretion system protein F [Candidatus Paceibacterota bacterium]